jgi:hypothetical protein
VIANLPPQQSGEAEMRILGVIIVALLLVVIGLQLRLIDITTKTHEEAASASYASETAAAMSRFSMERIRRSTPPPCPQYTPEEAVVHEECREASVEPGSRAPGRSFWQRLIHD